MIFQFERDFVDSLRCIPMVVRYKLDSCGVKLKLNHWHGLSQVQRQQLVTLPGETPTELGYYRQQLQQWVQALTGSPAQALEIPEHPPWLNPNQIPESVAVQLASLDLPALALSDWATLNPLQRFALLKLSRPGHENRNFVPALQEFGLWRSP